VYSRGIGLTTATFAWVITIAVVSAVRWVMLYPSLRAHTPVVVSHAPSADTGIVAGSASAFGILLATCVLEPEHAYALGAATIVLAAFVTLGIAVLARQRRIRRIEIASPFAIVILSGASTLAFVRIGSPYVGESLIAPLIATLALLGWGGVYRRAWAQLREEVRAELRHEPRRAQSAGTIVRLHRGGSDDPPPAA